MNPKNNLNSFPKHMASVLVPSLQVCLAELEVKVYLDYFQCEVKPHNLLKFRKYFMPSKLQMSKIVIICSFLKKKRNEK